MHLVSRVLLRAPLLPVRLLDDAERALGEHPLGEAALRLASPSLVDHADARAQATIRRYARRAAFRPTPAGLLAGVNVAELDERSAIALGDPLAALTPSWERLAGLGRALLDDEDGWAAARLRRAPSLVRRGSRATWLRLGDAGTAPRAEAELDPLAVAALDAAERWIGAPALARKLARQAGGTDDARELLRQLVDDGLLHHDLEPPLIGPPPSRWARERLGKLCALGSLDLIEDRAFAIEERLSVAERWSATLPGGGADRALTATLIFAGTQRIARAPLERAAELAPLLFALAEALAPPIAERELGGLDDAFAAASALVGEGLLSVDALELCDHGAPLSAARPRTPQPGVVGWLSGLVVEAARAGSSEIALDRAALEAAVPLPIAPPSFELQLCPCQGEGEDWLLGVHAPAGASWGRFAHALGPRMAAALAELREAERAVDGEALRLDVAYAPSGALADLCTAPALREAALAISSWPEGGAVTPSQCAIANEPLGPAHGGIALDDRPLEISPLSRVRSTSAPPSTARAMLADRLLRQHAPWALPWGPLARLPWLPRVRLEGFVIAPQSWALPAALDDDALARWRHTARVPRLVQVGAEDALLPLDLDDAADRATLRGLSPAERARAWEIWPPLGRELDEGGRRIELIACVVGEPDGKAARLAELGHASSPDEARVSGWRTLTIYAAPERHDELLDQIADFVAQQEPRAWFFMPYLEGGRHQLRVRLRGTDEAAVAKLAEALAATLTGAAAIEIGAYRRELARFGAEVERVERVFQADSLLAHALRGAPASMPREVLLATGLDALAAGLGLSPERRAVRCRAALDAQGYTEEEERERLAPAYRAVQRELLDLLAAPPAPFVEHQRRVKAAGLPARRAEQLLPVLAHLAAVRLCGPDRDAEVRGLYLWGRALESQRAMGKAKARPPRARSHRRE